MDSTANILQFCRLCLVKDGVNIPIFDEQGDIRQIYLKISSCLPVKVAREDHLPKKICDGCSNKLDICYDFWRTSAESEKQLLAWLGATGKDAAQVNVKEEDNFDEPLASDISKNDDDENKCYMFEQKVEEGPPVEINDEPPPSKRPRRTAAVKAAIAMDQNSDDDGDSGEPITKMEDDSDETDGDDREPAFVDVPSTSADDQPGPSGVSKDGSDAPCIGAKIQASKEDTTNVPQSNQRSKGIKIIQDIQITGSWKSDDCSYLITGDTTMINLEATLEKDNTAALGPNEEVAQTEEVMLPNQIDNQMESKNEAPDDDVIYEILDDEEQAPGPHEDKTRPNEAKTPNETGNKMQSRNEESNDDIICAILDEEQAPGPHEEITQNEEDKIPNQPDNVIESLNETTNEDIIYAILDEQQAPGPNGEITQTEKDNIPNQTVNKIESQNEAPNDNVYTISDDEEQESGNTVAENNENEKPNYISDSDEIPEVERPTKIRQTRCGSPKGTKSEATDSKTNKISLKCETCKLSFLTEESMRRHMSTMHAQFKCVHCQFVFFDEPSLKEHLSEKHEKFESCVLCQASLDSSESLLAHYRTIHSDVINEGKIWKCQKCNHSMVTEESMNNHVERMHPVRGTSCPICEKEFQTTEGVIQHIKASHILVITKPSCSNCKLVCANETHLMTHYKNTHWNKDQTTSDKGVDRPLSVKAIQEKYGGNTKKKFECYVCLMRFKRDFGLATHLKAVHDVEVFPEGVDQIWFVCPKCEDKFETKELALEHVRRGHVEKFKCEKCMAYFQYELHLEKHTESSCTFFWPDKIAEKYCCRIFGPT
ncbi:unnamed protein product [Callosobruchus maculatus]|uniref:ZAD domain-containing protein n=1 Tax=Callosobruchus maculatus TaxID=64391 RepID=A0A653C203_CALMS|nr:unnamed protein product [Callosobruchus maculatus]